MPKMNRNTTLMNRSIEGGKTYKKPSRVTKNSAVVDTEI